MQNNKPRKLGLFIVYLLRIMYIMLNNMRTHNHQLYPSIAPPPQSALERVSPVTRYVCNLY